MSEYDLRVKFPFSDQHFKEPERTWICRLSEVSDLRPESDRLSWYLVFEPADSGKLDRPVRKLEIVTTAAHVLSEGWPPDAAKRIEKWLRTGDQDGRVVWLDS